MDLDKQLDILNKRMSILWTEVENNEQRLNSMQQVFISKEE